MCIYSTYACVCVYMYVYIYIYAIYVHTASKYKTFVHTDRKGEIAQVSVSCRRANKPRGVLSDAAMLLHKQPKCNTQSFVVYPLADFLGNVFI